ncbi:hypothetical protein BV22DRAFT_922451 [Leucogyrophana mollusca]|uniref:Uncharacterized protein n=1 Tax=Leucogyrophana mollusca TaxID=85980 RepID=A0ACB8AYA2_9AGAM|nr:hypothetical protein BV22DRAFT_922451 [Leucogyrophana mollusca]
MSQSTSTTCLAATGYQWADNTIGQDPCIVAHDLFATTPPPCNDNDVLFPPITAGQYYPAPGGDGDANSCLCNTVIYSLVSACGLCQNATFLYWSQWIADCPVNAAVYQQWPASIPSTTEIPLWAYMPLVNNSWDGPQAKANASAVSLQVTSSTQPSGTVIPSLNASNTATPNNSSSANHTGAIAGGIVGGVLGVAALVFLGATLWRRRSRSIAHQSTPMYDPEPHTQYSHNTVISQNPFTNPGASLPRLYDPNDPTTFPHTPAPASENTHSNKLLSSNPGDGRYTGVPEL